MPEGENLPLSRQQMLVSFIFCLLLTIWSCPPAYHIRIGPGLDISWMWALNDALHNGRVFGRDFVFTYGPLGFLSSRNAECLPHYILFLGDIVMFACTFRLLWLIATHNRQWYWWLLLFPAIIAFREAGYSQQLFLLFITSVCMQIAVPRISWFQVIFAALSGILLFFIKVNYGIFTIPLLVVANVFTLCASKTKGIVQMIFAILLFTTLTAALPISIPDYICNSMPLISGYDEAMSLPTRQWIFYDFAIAMLIFTLIPIAAAVRKGYAQSLGWLRVVLLATIYLLCCLLFYKNAFTRSDYMHYIPFFATLPLFFLLLAMGCGFRSRQAGVASLAISAVSLCSLIYSPLDGRAVTLADIVRHFSITDYYKQLSGSASRNYDPAFTLPPSVCQRIGNKAVDLLPHELTWIWTNQLHYAPRPVPQSYSVYTKELDTLNAAFFAGEKRPDFVLINNISFEGRYAFWEESLTKAALRLNYRFDTIVDSSMTSKACVLYRTVNDNHGRPVFLPLLHTTAHLEEKIQVPVSYMPVYVSLKLKCTPEGQVNKLLAQPVNCAITFITADGQWHTFRFIRNIADHPVLISSFVADNNDLRRFLDGGERDNMHITSFFISTHSPGIEPGIDVQFSTFNNYWNTSF